MSQLQGTVTVVTGASRNGGRGIALVLGEAGATVYVTGHSIRGAQTTHLPGTTIEETAEMIHARGGVGIPVRVDHTVDAQVEALFARVREEQGRLDLLVNNAWGGYEMPDGFGAGEHVPFWELPLRQWELMQSAGLRSHLMASRYAVPLMLPQRHGLIVNTTTGIPPLGRYARHLFYDTTKVAINRLSFGMAQDCRPHGIAVVALSLGDHQAFMRTWEVQYPLEAMDPTFSPEYAGRAVVALATDSDVLEKSGQEPFLSVPALAREYGFTDIDGRQP